MNYFDLTYYWDARGTTLSLTIGDVFNYVKVLFQQYVLYYCQHAIFYLYYYKEKDSSLLQFCLLLSKLDIYKHNSKIYILKDKIISTKRRMVEKWIFQDKLRIKHSSIRRMNGFSKMNQSLVKLNIKQNSKH